MQEVFLTAQGYKELEERLEYLKTVRRHEVSEKIKIAREFGDISENAEYDSAKDEQAMVEGEILEIENKLHVAKIIDEDSASGQVVRLGSTVTFLNVSNDSRMTYQIVGTTEARSFECAHFQRISRRTDESQQKEGRDYRRGGAYGDAAS